MQLSLTIFIQLIYIASPNIVHLSVWMKDLALKVPNDL